MRSKYFVSRLSEILLAAVACLSVATAARAGEKVILAFDKTEGSSPFSGLVADAAGNLYGTTSEGGANGCGVAFELSPAAGGKWTESVLYTFQNCAFPGARPFGTMVIDKAGNLYGVARGDFNGAGYVFGLHKGANGQWTRKTLHQFNENEGGPYGELTWDSAGNLYGTTSFDTTTFMGVVFKLSPQTDGSWKETVLYTFPSPDGIGFPTAGVAIDSAGNLYGPTFFSPRGTNGNGAIYRLSPQAQGPWTLSLIFNFTTGSGFEPASRLIFDSTGNLFGTTTQSNLGEVYELSPTTSGPWKQKIIHTFKTGGGGSYPVGTLVFDSAGTSTAQPPAAAPAAVNICAASPIASAPKPTVPGSKP
jgi:uncharacterized repeat protein (TIGR03803 family)